jgi:uncharacterized protein
MPTEPIIESTRLIVLRLFRRLLIGALVLALLAYLALAAFLHYNQRRLIYFPARTITDLRPDKLFRVGDRALRAWVVNPGQRDAVLYFGGNGEAVERNVDFYRANLPGRTVYLVAYRGYGGNAGVPTESGLYADALAEFDQVAAAHGSVAVVGRSLGTGVATYVASKRPVERLVLVTPYDSLQNVAQANYPWMPIGLMLDDKFESWRRAPTLAMPVTLLVAAQDRLIPPSHAQALASKFPRPPSVVTIAGAGHNDISTKPGYAEAMRAAFDSPPAQ